MINIISKKYIEVFTNPNFSIGGKWKIALVSDNGNIEYPFGNIYQNNLILNNCLDILVKNDRYEPHLDLNWNTIPSFLDYSAVLGNGLLAPLNSDTQLTNETTFTFQTSDKCTIEDYPNQGLRVFKKVYEFPKPEDIQLNLQSYDVSEIGLKARYNDLLFTKFLLNSKINVRRGQWIRLFYDFYVRADQIANPLEINLSSGTFNAAGIFKLAGRFDDIFGSFDKYGKPVIVFGDSPRSSFMPFCEKFCVELDNCANQCFGTAYMLSDFIIDYDQTNKPLICEWVGNRLSVDNQSIELSNYTNGSFYRDMSYIFNYNNPSTLEKTGGFLFTNVKTNRQNTIDGWLWKFNNDQIKYVDKKIVINLRQSISRI